MERREQSPMLAGWVGGGARERGEARTGTITVPLADIVPSDIADSPDEHLSSDGYSRHGARSQHSVHERVWRWMITVEGTCTRTSTTPADRRRDALLSATRFVEIAKRIVRSEPARVTATVAHAAADGGAPNGSDGPFVLHLELRDADAATIGRVYERIAAEAWTIGRLSATKLVLAPHEANPSVLYEVRPQLVAGLPGFSMTGQRPPASPSDPAVHAQGRRIG